MAKKNLKEKALKLRAEGSSYSEIKNIVGVSKSTLSLWLKDLPLNDKRIRELRDNNPKRIERYRNTMASKKADRLVRVYEKVKNSVGKLSKRDLFIGGMFLYMGEGSKTTKGTTALTNTNPKILNLYIRWLQLHEIKKEKIKVQLHLYSDMSTEKQIKFWSKELSIPEKQFRKPHVKKSTSENISYKGQFGQGTCTVLYEDVDLHYTTLAYLRYVQETLK